ncbi:DUF1517 domain-containing protein [Chamaesiphon sp. GL140_3_metabinner_50]|uniref:DUF1517 domain-containing protein n=1 Tax=Chamaesiphon sp. GL140_3_metabinner_50 TaxID=2970812 RepID=UPI0025CE61E8|nr:DUF1517 domain-containing protein [Chamaesiphon sp. GL140_3_metabinner_50]
MIDKLRALLKPMIKSFVAVGLVLTLIFAQTGDALAARSGGRIGGGSFRAPSRGYSAPSGGGYGRGGGGFYPGGGLSPLFWFLPFSGGGGGLFSLLIMVAVGGFLLQTFRRVTGGDSFEGDVYNPQVAIAEIQVGLLANARSVQSKLDQLAETVNTDTASGRMHLLQETSLELLRHPEYWTYAKTSTQQAKLDRAEAVFNQLSLNERGKFTTETLSKVNNQLRQADASPILNSTGELTTVAQPERAEYIIVTLLVAATRSLDLPKINGDADLRQALQTLGSVDASSIVAIEAIWTPQANGDALTTDDILAYYPDLKLV